jgi:hypothetical protein
MIRKPTVLMLGAGASQPCKFPLGSDLVDEICNEITSGNILTTSSSMPTRLANLGYDMGLSNEFALALRGARAYYPFICLSVRDRTYDFLSFLAVAGLTTCLLSPSISAGSPHPR